ncbi:hypothetical protein PHYSODRAFT_331733 [Phytophthora sojae]|uniref:Uncharacterized protein n=1 Tax=Phytophthora sojae (strain P6497) TaxID=1094619 RepID=G4ZCS1_PHYSP|nr:hypothetical protein PHYSODRAFT_331733 [Phytophthora sojae]EGZ17803.1 hypothetical protein PHYSODRAFT_331733 [Phytophthora sojae]|eukprot:XP_009526861.1 hypothetical protein PHYSODRAFT_331733 [Phytophthora sojae]
MRENGTCEAVLFLPLSVARLVSLADCRSLPHVTSGLNPSLAKNDECEERLRDEWDVEPQRTPETTRSPGSAARTARAQRPRRQTQLGSELQDERTAASVDGLLGDVVSDGQESTWHSESSVDCEVRTGTAVVYVQVV